MHLLSALAMWAACLGSLSTAMDGALDAAWGSWKSSYAKEYPQGDEDFRRSVWEKNLQAIGRHNREASSGKHPYRLGMNHLGDLTNGEFNERLNGFRHSESGFRKANGTWFQPSGSTAVPRQIDWRMKGCVTAVKDQGSCGSCWAFSATGALEGQQCKRSRKLVSLSEQNLIDCSGRPQNYGCEGGNATRAFEYVKTNGGIDSERSYPYRGKKGKCVYDARSAAAKCTSYEKIQAGNEKALQEALATHGPISVAMDSRSKEFQFYRSGIFSCPWRGDTLNHAVLLVGYATLRGKDYWILKNSWSHNWGERGYFRLAKGRNECGIADGASRPVTGRGR